MVRKFPAIQIQSLTRLLYDKGKDKGAKNKSTIQDYSANLRYGNVGFYWDPAGRWLRAHGYGKSTSGGKFFTETMKTSGDKPVYSVRVMQDDRVVLKFEMPGEAQPSDDDVVRELKQRT